MPIKATRLGAAFSIVSLQLGLTVAVSHIASHRPGSIHAVFDKEKALVDSAYAYVRFANGELAEAKGKDGSWLKCTVLGRGSGTNTYHVRIEDDVGDVTLPSVPGRMLRRLLGPGERDFFVDNSALNHSGVGVKYRYRKDLKVKGVDYAPWGTMVSGTDEGDGWVRLNLLNGVYLPTSMQGVRIVVPAGRGVAPPAALEQAAAGPARSAGAAPAAFEAGDRAEFRAGSGEWQPARVAGPGAFPGTYRVYVTPTDQAVYPINDVPGRQLRRVVEATTTPAPRASESALCRKDECISVTVRTQEGREFFLRISIKTRVSMLMKMVCNKVKVTWEDCQERSRFVHRGAELSPYTHVEVSGLEDGSVVFMGAGAPTLVASDAAVPPAGAGFA